MGGVLPTPGLVLLFNVCISSVIFIDAATRTGRTYGTWVDRRKQRECKHNLVCEYRSADCINATPENQWACTAVNNAMQAKMCTLKLCDQAKGMVCLDVVPGENMTEVSSDTCPLGKTCYAPVNMTTAVNTPATSTTNIADTTASWANEATTSGRMTISTGPAVAGTDTTGSVTAGSIADENATDIIWTSAGQGNSTLIP